MYDRAFMMFELVAQVAQNVGLKRHVPLVQVGLKTQCCIRFHGLLLR